MWRRVKEMWWYNFISMKKDLYYLNEYNVLESVGSFNYAAFTKSHKYVFFSDIQDLILKNWQKLLFNFKI